MGEFKMNTFNHSHYESINFYDDGSAILDTHGFRLRIRMHIPEQKIVHWNDLFSRIKVGDLRAGNGKDL
jgi:hypothetical protein